MCFDKSESNGSKRKYDHETDETTFKPKIQRPNSPAPPPSPPPPAEAAEAAAVTQPTKITDLDDLCLEEIFMHLDVQSLFNVAAANAWLRPTAQFIYKRKFGTRMVCLAAMKKCECECLKDRADDNIVIIFGFKTTLEYLRCLGPSIAYLSVMHRDATTKWSECIDQYIQSYCSESLNTLAILEKTRGPLAFDEKPFVNVQTVVIMNSDLTNQLASFPKWFPNLHILELHNVRMYDRSVEQPFQHLQRLAIDMHNGTRCNGFTKFEAAHLLRLCPAVMILHIHMPAVRQGMTLKTLANLIKNNQTIRQLKVSMERYWSYVQPSEIQQFASEHPTISSICFENYIFTADTAIAMIRQLTDLKYFKFQINNPMEYTAFVGRLDEQWKSSVFTDLSNRFIVEMIPKQ